MEVMKNEEMFEWDSNASRCDEKFDVRQAKGSEIGAVLRKIKE